jgi:hypothetical protein
MSTGLTPIYSRNKVLLVKTETVYGTDAAPTATTNAILASQFKMTPKSEVIERDLDLPGGGAPAATITNIHADIEFEFELAYSGTAGTAPPWGVIIKNSAFSETILASTSVTYATISSGFLACSFYYYKSGNLYKFTGSRLATGIKGDAGKNGVFYAKGKGLVSLVGTASLPSVSALSSWPTPKPLTVQNTPLFTLNSVNLALLSFDIPPGFQVSYSNVPNDEQIRNGRRKITGVKLEVRQGLISEFNPFALRDANTPVPFVLTHGGASTGTPIITINMPNFQIETVEEGDKDDEATWIINGRAQAAFTGDGDLTIVCAAHA